MKFLKSKLAVMSFAFAVMFGLGSSALAAPSSTPTEVLDTVAGGTIDQAINLLTYVITHYLGYILVLGLCVILYGLFKRFTHIVK